MTAKRPKRVRVIVGRLHTLAFGINAAQSLTVILHKVLGAALSWCLVLHIGADLFVGIAVCRKRWQQLNNKVINKLSASRQPGQIQYVGCVGAKHSAHSWGKHEDLNCHIILVLLLYVCSVNEWTAGRILFALKVHPL